MISGIKITSCNKLNIYWDYGENYRKTETYTYQKGCF